MSLQKDILKTEIKKLKHEKMSDAVAEKLARYWCAMQALCDEHEEAEVYHTPVAARMVVEEMEPITEGNGAFHNAIRGKDMHAVCDVLEQHFAVLQAIAPKHYTAVMTALDKL